MSVILKSLNDSQNMTTDFLQEIVCHKLVSYSDGSPFAIVPCYGISQDPATKNYLMVMQYIDGGNLRQYLQNNCKLDFYQRLSPLLDIANGLNSIHQQGLIHRDFHPGNILNSFVITDLGLCRPANELDNGKVFGVLPYVAPEVLKGEL